MTFEYNGNQYGIYRVARDAMYVKRNACLKRIEASEKEIDKFIELVRFCMSYREYGAIAELIKKEMAKEAVA